MQAVIQRGLKNNSRVKKETLPFLGLVGFATKTPSVIPPILYLVLASVHPPAWRAACAPGRCRAMGGADH
jgi:hypothetical protein